MTSWSFTKPLWQKNSSKCCLCRNLALKNVTASALHLQHIMQYAWLWDYWYHCIYKERNSLSAEYCYTNFTSSYSFISNKFESAVNYKNICTCVILHLTNRFSSTQCCTIFELYELLFPHKKTLTLLLPTWTSNSLNTMDSIFTILDSTLFTSFRTLTTLWSETENRWWLPLLRWAVLPDL